MKIDINGLSELGKIKVKAQSILQRFSKMKIRLLNIQVSKFKRDRKSKNGINTFFVNKPLKEIKKDNQEITCINNKSEVSNENNKQEDIKMLKIKKKEDSEHNGHTIGIDEIIKQNNYILNIKDDKHKNEEFDSNKIKTKKKRSNNYFKDSSGNDKSEKTYSFKNKRINYDSEYKKDFDYFQNKDFFKKSIKFEDKRVRLIRT